MKLNCCVIFTVLFLNLYGHSRAVDPIELAGKIFAKYESNGHTKLEFSDLHEDCMVIILEMSSLDVLINVAELDHRHFLMAKLAFKRRYGHRHITIKTDFFLPHVPKVESSLIGDALKFLGFKKEEKVIAPKPRGRAIILENDSSIEIKDYESIEKTFKIFGCVMPKLKILYCDFRHRNAEFIGNLISNFSSQYLEDFHIVAFQDRVCSEDNLEYITKPLINVKKVTFEERFNIAGNGLPLNELFPAVEFLNINSWCWDLARKDLHLPHLQHLFIRSAPLPHWRYILENPSYFKRLMGSNTQIRSLELHMIPEIPAEHIQLINELLPNLENLTLSTFEDTNEMIRFENLTHLALKSHINSPPNFRIPKLRSLYAKLDRDTTEAWKQFLRQHNNITTLHMKFITSWIGNNQLINIDRFTGDLSNLIEFTWLLKQPGMISTEDTRNMLRNHAKLKRCDFIANYYYFDPITFREQFETIIEFEADWMIVVIPNGLSLQRVEAEQ